MTSAQGAQSLTAHGGGNYFRVMRAAATLLNKSAWKCMLCGCSQPHGRLMPSPASAVDWSTPCPQASGQCLSTAAAAATLVTTFATWVALMRSAASKPRRGGWPSTPQHTAAKGTAAWSSNSRTERYAVLHVRHRSNSLQCVPLCMYFPLYLPLCCPSQLDAQLESMLGQHLSAFESAEPPPSLPLVARLPKSPEGEVL